YGYEFIEPAPVMHYPFLDGASITVWRDLDRTCASIAAVSKKDAETFRRLVPEYKAYMESRAEEGRGAAKNGLWARRNAMSGYDLVNELYESNYMRAASLAGGHFGGVPGGDPGTGGQAFSMIPQLLEGRPIPKGGSGMLSVSLRRFIEAHNGVVLTNKPVTELVID